MQNRRITLVRPSQIFDSFMDEFFNSNTGVNSVYQGGVDVDMYEDDTHVVVSFKAPGFKKDDIKITLEDNVLTVEGTVKKESEEQSKKYFLKEVAYENFIRSVSLPAKVKPEEAEAKLENGIMTIKLPKAEEIKPKTITIKAD